MIKVLLKIPVFDTYIDDHHLLDIVFKFRYFFSYNVAYFFNFSFQQQYTNLFFLMLIILKLLLFLSHFVYFITRKLVVSSDTSKTDT